MATSAGLNVLLDASSFVANVSATCFVFMVGWFRSTLLKSGVFFSGRTFSIAGPQRREVFFSGRAFSVANFETCSESAPGRRKAFSGGAGLAAVFE